MSRLQVSNDFGGQLQTQARPIAQTEQVARPREDTRWKALANVFAGGAMLADQMREQKNEEDREAATRWAQSMTVSELGKAIKEGKMLPSQSPVFVGTVQHIWGVNAHEAGIRDISGKLTTGELKFNSAEEADTYLTEWRNTTLSGQSKYAVAGFDRNYAGLRDKVMDQVRQINDETWVDNAQVQAADYLANSLNKVAGADFKGTPQEGAAELMRQYQLLRQTRTLPDAAAKGALGEMVTGMAGSGRTDLLGAFLNTEMEGIGSVRGFIGEAKAQTLTHQAEAAYDQGQRQRIDSEMLPWYKQADAGTLNVGKLEAWAADPANAKYVSSATVHSLARANMAVLAAQQRELLAARMQGAVEASEHEARRKVDAATSAGRLWEVQGTNTPQVLSKTGEPKDFDVKGYAAQSLAERTRAMPFHQQVAAWSQNGLDNPNWKNELTAGFLNLATIGIDSKGKPMGQLNEAGKRSISLFRELDAVNADYARGLVGEKTYERFSDIGFLMHLGRSPDDAAGIAAGVASGAIVSSDVDKLTKKVHAQVAKLTEGPWYKPDWAAKIMGENTTTNTAQVSGSLRRYATLLAHSGQYGDAEAAVSAAFAYLADDKVSARINGTLYLKSELPTAPATLPADEWFKRYLDAVPRARAKELFGKDSDVRMEFDPTIRAYRAFIAGVPLTNADGSLMVTTRDAIQAWYTMQNDALIAEGAAQGTANIQARKDTAEAGKRVSEWVKTHRAITPQASAQTPPEDSIDARIAENFSKPFREQPVIDFSGLKKADPNAKPGERLP